MTKLLFRTKGNSEPGKKPRVYFSCLPEDFGETFDAVCEDIFKTQDCIIFYKEDMADELPEETWETDLGRMNLFVFPVTYQMLQDEDSPVNRDLAFADQEKKPVLPIMFEKSVGQIILEFYDKKFGERQYLSKFSTDSTEISYEEKLKKYLEGTLISDEMAEKIRKAFDAYVFLSYRKKDRKYANELMRLIHADPLCRAIAVWFDEFLTPGESFNDSIEKALRDSKMVALLVTPSLLEGDAQGNKNYVQRVEYPNARLSGKPILPAEKVFTDREALAADYEDLPEIVDANNEEQFHEEFKKAISDAARGEDEGDPMHDFLIGLAYLEGIDVEINPDYGVGLVTSAAEAGLAEAMEKLYHMYQDGNNVPVNYQKSCEWVEKLYQHYLAHNGEEDPKTLSALSNLSEAYEKKGDYEKAIGLEEKAYHARLKTLGPEHADTLASLSGMGVLYNYLGDYAKAAEIHQKAYELYCKAFGEEHPHTLNCINNLAASYFYLGDYQKEYESAKKSYEVRCRVVGEEDPNTLSSLCELASGYRNIGDYQNSLELDLKAFELRCRVLGKEHPDTLSLLNNIAIDYMYLGNNQKAAEYFLKSYEGLREVLGEEHPYICTFLNNLAVTYMNLGEFQKALEINQKCYEVRCRVQGKEHPNTLGSLDNIGIVYGNLGDYHKELECQEKCYLARCKILGEEHPDALESLTNLAVAYSHLENFLKAIELGEKCLELKRKVLGEEHPYTLVSLQNLACAYGDQGDYGKAKELLRQCYETRRRILGEEHCDTLLTIADSAYYTFLDGEKEKAVETFRGLYETFCRITNGEHAEELKHCKETLDQISSSGDGKKLSEEMVDLIRKL